MKARLELALSEPARGLFGVETLRAPVLEGGQRVEEYAALVEFLGGKLGVDGRTYGGWEELSARDLVVRDLETLSRNQHILHPNLERATMPFYVLAQRDAPAQTVIALAGQVGPAFEPRLLVLQPGYQRVDPVPEGAPQSLRDRVQAFEVMELPDRAKAIAVLMQESAKRCDPLMSVLAKSANLDTWSKAKLLSARVPAALQECQCGGVDVDGIEAAAISLFDSPVPPVSWLPLVHSDLGPNATVDDLARVLAGRTVSRAP